jgi:putative addiction module component (TIGR02574 family)
MSVAFELVENEALKLERNERIMLGQELLVSAMTQEETSIEGEWVELSHRRLQELNAGLVKALPGEDVMAEAFAKFRK